MDRIKPDWFIEPKNQMVYKTLVDLVTRGLTPSPALIQEKLGPEGWEYIGGDSFIGDILAGEPTMVAPYIEIIEREFQRAQLQQIAFDIQKSIRDGGNPIDVVGGIQQRTMGMLPDANNTTDIMASWLTEIMGDKEPRVTTGIEPVDEILKLRDGKMFIVAGRPQEGKTTLSLNIMLNCLKHDKKVAMFSLEMCHEDVLSKLFSQYSQIPLTRITDGALTVDDVKMLGEFHEFLSSKTFLLDDKAGVTVNYIFSKAKTMMMMRGLDVVIIDYFHLLAHEDMEGEVAGLSKMSWQLKTLSKELMRPIIVVAQLNRGSVTTTTGSGELNEKILKFKEPELHNLRGTGSLEQDADAVAFIYTKPDGVTELKLAKNRMGTKGKIPLIFDAGYSTFRSRTNHPTETWTYADHSLVGVVDPEEVF
jgi:replicative DNA helicase